METSVVAPRRDYLPSVVNRLDNSIRMKEREVEIHSWGGTDITLYIADGLKFERVTSSN